MSSIDLGPTDLGEDHRNRCGRRLRRRREELGLNLEQAADALKAVGKGTTTGAAVSAWERGDNMPRLSHQFACAKLYGCTPDELFGFAETDRDRADDAREIAEAHAAGKRCFRGKDCTTCRTRKAA